MTSYYQSVLKRILELVESASNSLGVAMCATIVDDGIFDADDALTAIKGIAEQALEKEVSGNEQT